MRIPERESGKATGLEKRVSPKRIFQLESHRLEAPHHKSCNSHQRNSKVRPVHKLERNANEKDGQNHLQVDRVDLGHGSREDTFEGDLGLEERVRRKETRRRLDLEKAR